MDKCLPTPNLLETKQTQFNTINNFIITSNFVLNIRDTESVKLQKPWELAYYNAYLLNVSHDKNRGTRRLFFLKISNSSL